MRRLVISVVMGVAALPATATYAAAVHAESACHTVHRGTGVLRLTERACGDTVTMRHTPAPHAVHPVRTVRQATPSHPFALCTWCTREEV